MAGRRDASGSSSRVSTTSSAKAKARKASGAHVLATANTTSPRRRPRQERARFTVASILQAAAEVIDDLGWSRASTNRIAERAGVSIGSLYQYFPNKEAILAGLFERHHLEVNEVVGASLELVGDPATPLAEALQKLFRDLIEMHHRDPVLTRVLSTEVPMRAMDEERGSGHDPEALVSLLRTRPDVRDTDLDTVARILEITVEALTRWLVHEAPEDADVDVFVERSVAMLCALLTGATAEV